METVFMIYVGVGIVWFLFFLIGIFVNADDKDFIKLPIRGAFLTPVWPLVIVFLIGLGAVKMWKLADWRDLF